MKFKAGFIGCGNMGGALATAAAKSIDMLAVADCDKKKASSLAESLGCTAVDAKEIAECAKYIFLGVKPQGLSALFDEIAPILKNRDDEFILVTMAAGTSINDIANLAGAKFPIIRIMPNTPASIGKGIILYCSDGVSDMSEFCHMMKHAGMLDEIPEKLIDAASCVTGCSPAWIYMFIEALADGGVNCGLPRDKAISYACDALIGAASLVKESGKHPGLLKDEVTSPGGTTIAGVKALEDGAFRGCIIDAVTKAYEKTINLKK